MSDDLHADEPLTPRHEQGHPPQLSPEYKSTVSRSPTRPLVALPRSLSERTGPVLGHEALTPLDHDLTCNAVQDGEPLGERIVVTGRVLDEMGRPIPDALVEVWQANAAGRYPQINDQHDAPLDPNFLGAGRCVTNAGGEYEFITLKPGAYPWPNHDNAWRPAHIHFSVFGPSIATRIVTQMYFPGDPLLALDPILQAVPKDAQSRLVAEFSLADTVRDWALGYRFDIVLRGPRRTPTE